MYSFKRGLSEEFVSALLDSYAAGGLWKGIVEDPELFIGIRDNYLNVYYHGNSLLKLTMENGCIRAATHYKYLLRNKIEKPYISFDFGPEARVETGGFDGHFFDRFDSLHGIKKSSRPYASLEKSGVHDIVKANKNIIDVEVALSREAEESEEAEQGGAPATAPRVDFAALREGDNGVELHFYEAKHFSYHGALRSSKEEVDAVGQVQGYEKLLKKYEGNAQISKSYHIIARNLVDILPDERVDDLVRRVAYGEKLTVCMEPKLVIFGFDSDQKAGNAWKPHLKKLQEQLGKGRVLAKGDAKNFTNGIC